LGGGQGRLTLAPGCFDAGVDTVYLVASDNAVPALADTAVIEITVLDKNCAPQVTLTVPDTIRINQCQNLSFAVSAADPDSSGTVSLFAAPTPPFATVTDLGGGSGSLNLFPAITDLGPYTVQVLASDGQDTGIVTLPVQVFQKGDLNRDGTLGPSDVVLLMNCIFSNVPPPAGAGTCDMDGGGPSTSDVVALLNATFLSDPLPPC
jgi:hypothetical protein